MILPNKYIPISSSFIGESAKILRALGAQKLSIDKLWKTVNNTYLELSLEKFIQVITFMYACELIGFDDKEGMIYNENLQS